MLSGADVALLVTALTTLVAAVASAIVAVRTNGKVDVVHAAVNGNLADVKTQLAVALAVNDPPQAARRTAVQPLPVVSDDVAVGAGATPAWYPPSFLPTWPQAGTILPDGNPDPGQWNDCGETCVCMVVAGVHGVPLDPGGVRQHLQGVGGNGLTTGQDLVNALRYYSVNAHVEYLVPETAWINLAAAVAAGHPVIMLGRWASVGGAMHWQIGVMVHPGRVEYINPYGPTRSVSLKLDWLEQYAGQLVIVDAHVHYDCRSWGIPT